jgi:hypothetical protein
MLELFSIFLIDDMNLIIYIYIYIYTASKGDLRNEILPQKVTYEMKFFKQKKSNSCHPKKYQKKKI